MDILSNVSAFTDLLNNTLSQEIQSTNNTVVSAGATTINLNGNYSFQDEDAMESLMNNIGLAVQRRGGQ